MGWSFGGLGAALLLLLLVAVISLPSGGPFDCEDAGTGDVTAVGNYPEPLRFGPFTMYPGQLVFADVVAKRTRWDVWVIRAQVLNEMNGAAALGRVRENNHNWLNVGYFDELGGGGAFQQSGVWGDPVRAGNATADWIQGERETINSTAAPSIREAYEKGANATPAEAIRLLQTSRWATSGYPQLPGIYRAISSAGRGTAAPTVRAGVVPVAEPVTCDDGSAAVGGGIASAGVVAKKYLHATSPAQMPGFTGAFPVGAWCSWFVTNVLRKVGVDIPVLPYSGAPYTWAKDHPTDWTMFKPMGRPALGKTPPVGSLVMYKDGGGGSPTRSDHINMVEKTYPDGSFDVIGGNQGSGCPTGSCVSEHKACRLIGWNRPADPHLDCGDDRPIWGIVTPKASGTAT